MWRVTSSGDAGWPRSFSQKRLRAGDNVDDFGLSEAKIARNGPNLGQLARQFYIVLESARKFEHPNQRLFTTKYEHYPDQRLFTTKRWPPAPYRERLRDDFQTPP